MRSSASFRSSRSSPPSGPGLIGGLFRTVWLLVVLLTPLLGTWFSSSLAAARGAPVWLAAAAGLLLFPVLPLAWELRASARRARERIRPRRPSLSTRLTLRTLALNVAFLALVLGLWPKPLFAALSTRGDWMLPPGGDERVQLARRALFDTADALEWAYVLARQDPYSDQLVAVRTPRPDAPPAPEHRAPPPAPVPPTAEASPAVQPPSSSTTPPEPSNGTTPSPEPSHGSPVAQTGAQPQGNADEGDDEEGGLIEISWKDSQPAQPQQPAQPAEAKPKPAPAPRPQPDESPRVAGEGAPWPFAPTLHPLVAQMPASAETDIASVARYIADRERDPFQRVKALHDYVADRVAYDVKAYRTHQYPPQNAEEVFKTHMAVCAGYTNLFVALGQGAGEEIIPLSGDSRRSASQEALEAHAWSAAHIQGRWYLIDVTWDAGYVNDDTFTKAYKTSYLMAPPELFLARHFPNDPAWQLLRTPVSRGDFLRRPIIEPAVFAGGFEAAVRVLEPERSQVEARGRFNVQLDNPRELRTQVRVIHSENGKDLPCTAISGSTRFECTVEDRGLYRVEVFAAPPEYRELHLVAHFEVTNT